MMAPFIGASVSVYSNNILISIKNKLDSVAADSDTEISGLTVDIP
jgi:hypothetical protein